MKIQFIERIKEFFEKRKLKKLSDSVLEEKIDKNIEGEGTGKIPLIIGAVEDEKTQIELAKRVVESTEVPMATKTDTLNELPHRTRVKLFKESVKGKELIARDVEKFTEIVVNNKSLQPYDELYYRLDKAFSDNQLGNILSTLKEKRPESYDEEKVLRIVAKQIDVNIKNYGAILPSHLAPSGLFSQIVLSGRDQNEERAFDILNPEDKQRLLEALKEEREEMEENPKIALTESELKRLSDENLEKQINQVEQFTIKRQEELLQQNKGKEI